MLREDNGVVTRKGALRFECQPSTRQPITEQLMPVARTTRTNEFDIGMRVLEKAISVLGVDGILPCLNNSNCVLFLVHDVDLLRI